MALELLYEIRELLGLEDSDSATFEAQLNTLAQVIADGGPDSRKEIVDEDGYLTVVEIWKKYCTHEEEHDITLTPDAVNVLESVLKVLYALTAGFPEIVDENGFITIQQAFNPAVPESTKIQGLKFMRNVCTRSEHNRELIEDKKIVQPFAKLIKTHHHHHNPSAELIREWCGTLRAFVLNDDRRVVYNRSAERKRLIFHNDAHSRLAHFLNIFMDIPTLNAIVNVLTLMVSNQDLCLAIEANGGLRGLQHVLENNNFNVRLMKNTLACVRSVCRCPAVREKCAAQTPILKVVLNLASMNRSDPDLVELAFGCLAFMTLRCPAACEQFLTEQGVRIVSTVIGAHLENTFVLKNACFTLRNIAASGGAPCKAALIEAQIEPLLHDIAARHEELIANHVNPALRDLGLNVISGEADLMMPITSIPSEPLTVVELRAPSVDHQTPTPTILSGGGNTDTSARSDSHSHGHNSHQSHKTRAETD